MSTTAIALQVGTATPATVPGLAAGQTAWTLDTGDMVVIEATQPPIAGAPSSPAAQQHVAIKMRAWKVNADGTPAAGSAGIKLEAPARVETILASGLAENTVTLSAQLASYTTAALNRIRTWLLVKAQLASIPHS
jgi:hypothetical protein